ncbi:AAA family ATPase [Chitinibacter sp. FCG-7]|uniref:AAA family ATPase n=1 Tax=Chitinibacter mangrovi TaxID=3153927 RepID=A0AAU7FEX3_9NEIS
MTESKKLESVFTLSGVPDFTFVEPQEYTRLFVALRTKGRGIVIEGPSGIGKTTCVLKALERLGLNSEEVSILSARKKKDVQKIQDIINQGEGFGTVLIDDFHKLDDNKKTSLSNLLKTLADEGDENSKLVIIGINKTGHSLLTYSSDLRNRIDIIKFEANSEEKLEELLEKGESALNIKINVKNEIVSESQGSFHIAQMLAHHACLKSGITEERAELTETSVSFETLKEFILDDLSISFDALVINFCKGQRVKKGSRAPYFHVLYWLSKSSTMDLIISDELNRNPKHKNSVGQILTKNHLIDHFLSNPSYSEVIFYNNETTGISVEDPKFFYYIKNLAWAKVAKKIGFHAIEFKSTYDFALSFAGAEREYAEYLFKKLAENEMSVFYDFNEQSRILSNNVEEYLAPIYRADSQFIIPILSSHYPTRIWCKFEADQFKIRFGENAIIPLRLSDCTVGMFDESNGVGGFTLDVNAEINPQLDKFANILADKIHDLRAEEMAEEGC